MISVCCRRSFSPAYISNYFKTNYQRFSVFSSPKSKPSLVRSTQFNIINCKWNSRYRPKGVRYKNIDNIPEDYVLVYRERHVSFIISVLAGSYAVLICLGYALIRYNYGWEVNWEPNWELPFANIFDEEVEKKDEKLEVKGKEVEEKKFEEARSMAYEFFARGGAGYAHEELVYTGILLISCVISIRFMLRVPVRVYQNGNNNIGVCMGLLGPFNKKYIHWEHMDCRPIQPFGMLVWRNWQFEINGKYYILIRDYFKSSADFNRACVNIRKPTLINKIFQRQNQDFTD